PPRTAAPQSPRDGLRLHRDSPHRSGPAAPHPAADPPAASRTARVLSRPWRDVLHGGTPRPPVQSHHRNAGRRDMPPATPEPVARPLRRAAASPAPEDF